VVVVSLDRAVGFPLPAVITAASLKKPPWSLWWCPHTTGVCYGATDREYSAEGTQKGGLNILPGTSPQRECTLNYGDTGGTTVPPNIYYSTRVLLVLYFLKVKGGVRPTSTFLLAQHG
jgi:hypothetical protein